jgi:hypothetical protein
MSGIGAYLFTHSVCASCRGNAKCAECDGTGVNTHLNEDEPKSPGCSGTGVCRSCDGTGLFGQDSGPNNL